MAVTADYILKLNQQRLELIDVVNNLVDETDKLDSSATLDDVVKRLKTIDTFSILRNYIQPDIINPNSDWSIDDTEGKIVMLRDCAFHSHKGLRSVNLRSCNIVNGSAFQGCTSLVQAKISGKDLAVKGAYTFNGCTALTSLSFPHLKGMYGRYMCEGCSNLKSVTYNKDGGATISDSYNIFSGCANLKAHIFPSKDEVTTVDGYYTNNINSTAYIYIPKCMLHIYKETWMNDYITAGRVRCIENYDFDDERYTNNRDYLINVLGADLSDYVIEEYVEPNVRMELQKYGSNSLIATIDNKQYKKSNWGLAIVCVIKFDTYSGVLLVSKKADCVTYVGGGYSYANTSDGKITYNGEDYYYSARKYFTGNATSVVSDYPLLNDVTNKSYTNDIDGSVEAAKDLLDYYFKKI